MVALKMLCKRDDARTSTASARLGSARLYVHFFGSLYGYSFLTSFLLKPSPRIETASVFSNGVQNIYSSAINTSILEYVLMYLLLVRPCIKYCAISILKSRKNILVYYTA